MMRGPSAAWLNRGWVLLGRGATGLFPVLLFGIASRRFGLAALGEFAAVYMLAQSVAEIADFTSQRHVSRLVASSLPRELVDERIAAFHALRLLALSIALAIALVAAWVGFGSGHILLDVALLPVAAWVFATNTYYATALALRRFVIIGVGPTVSLVVVAVVAVTLPLHAPFQGIWTIVVAIHVAKLCELLLLSVSLPGPTLAIFRDWLGREWMHTRYLFWQGALSAANARLIVPLTALAGGARPAGLLSIGLSLLGVTSLVSVAVMLPAYRDVLETGQRNSPAEAMQHARKDWVTGTALGVAVTLGLCLASAWILGPFFGVTGHEESVAIVLILLGGIFESVNLFGGALYHASHQDRRLFRLSGITMSLNWLAVVVGVREASVVGMAAGLFVSRAVGVLVLYYPIVLAWKRPRWVAS